MAWRAGKKTGRKPSGPGPARVAWHKLLPWPVAAAVGAVGAVLAAGLICLVLPLVGWLSDMSQPLSGPFGLAADLLLVANGASVVVGGVSLSVVPLGLTLIIIAAGMGVTRVLVRHGFAAAPGPSAGRVGGVAAVVAVTYAVLIAVVAWLAQPASLGRAAVGGVLVGAVVGWAAAAPLFGWRLAWGPGIPAWVKALPRAVGAAAGLLLAGGAIVLAIAIASSGARIEALQGELMPGRIGGVLLVVLQALWLPNFVVWCAAWLVGAGFALGVGTVVSPVAVDLGMLPAVPVFGAVPQPGSPPAAMALWLLVPVVAGIAAAWVAMRAQVAHDRLLRETPRLDVGGLIGGAAGILSGLAVTVLAAITKGDFGSVRLVGLGPRLGPMVLLAPSLFGFAGLVAGVLLAWRWNVAAAGVKTAPPTAPRPPTPPAPPAHTA